MHTQSHSSQHTIEVNNSLVLTKKNKNTKLTVIQSKTALALGPTNGILTFDHDLTFNLNLDLQSQESYGDDPYIMQKVMVKENSVQKLRVETDGWRQLQLS